MGYTHIQFGLNPYSIWAKRMCCLGYSLKWELLRVKNE